MLGAAVNLYSRLEVELLHDCLSTKYILNDLTISECPGCVNYCERKDISIIRSTANLPEDQNSI